MDKCASDRGFGGGEASLAVTYPLSPGDPRENIRRLPTSRRVSSGPI
ncbi:MAG: hypothetical protein RIS76_909 [Verrucomicrobiota bacterium]